MKILISGIGRSGTTTIFSVLGDALLKYNRDAETIYEPYLWNIREAFKTASVIDQPFDNNQLNTFGIYTHTHTPIFLNKPTGLHDLWLQQNFSGLKKNKNARLVKVIRGAGRLEAIIKSLPDLKIIMVTRNPVATINSGLGLFSFFGDEFHPSDRKRFICEVNENWGKGYDASKLDNEYKWSVLWWKYLTKASFDVAKRYPSNIFVLPYELYINNKRQWILDVFKFVGLPECYLNHSLLDVVVGPLTSVCRLTQREIASLEEQCLLYSEELKTRFPNDIADSSAFSEKLIKKYTVEKFASPLVQFGELSATAAQLRKKYYFEAKKQSKKLKSSEQIELLKDVVKKDMGGWPATPPKKLKLKIGISVIVTCYNNEKTIRSCINSVLDQEVDVREIIVADDFSSDASRQIITQLASANQNIILSFNERNLGVAANRDRAIRLATSDLITTLDGDDLFLPSKLKAEYAALEKHSFNGIAYSDIFLVDRSGTTKVETGSLNECKGSEALQRICTRQMPVPRDMLFQKSLYIKAGGFDVDIGLYEDWLLKMKLTIADANVPWLYSGQAGIVYDRRSPGLSDISFLEEFIHQLIALNRAQAMLGKKNNIIMAGRAALLKQLERHKVNLKSNSLLEKIVRGEASEEEIKTLNS